MLKMGDNGDNVVTLQKLLNAKMPGTKLPLTGRFLQMTRTAVIAFQKSVHLKPDGVVGPATWKALGGSEVQADTTVLEPSWMAIARGELGVTEIRDKGQHNPRIVAYLNTCTNISQSMRDQDETAWCSAFVNWVMKHAGYAGTNHALATSWLQWGHTLPQPMSGAIMVIRKSSGKTDTATGSSTGNHVGFFVSSRPGFFTLLGGNQGGGLRVCESDYSTSSYTARGCRWPLPVGDINAPTQTYA